MWSSETGAANRVHALRQGSAGSVGNNQPVYYTDNGSTLNYCGTTTNHSLVGTSGQLLFSLTFIKDQIYCTPSTGNSGYWYTWSASTAGGTLSSGNESNSICPSGWQLSTNTATDTRSYYYLIRTAYNDSSSSDSNIRLLPMSFIRSGLYNNGSLNYRGGSGNYWSSAARNSNSAYNLRFSSGYLSPQDYYYKNYGFSVRCVAR